MKTTVADLVYHNGVSLYTVGAGITSINWVTFFFFLRLALG